LTSKFAKSAYIKKKKKIKKKSNMGIKNAEFHADFESIEKVAKTDAKKVPKKKWREFFTFILCAKLFGL
jgi:hypothetical protein